MSSHHSHHSHHRVNVTFSEETDGGMSIEQRLKQAIQQKFAAVDYSSDALIARILGDIGVSKSPQNELHQLGPTGVWKPVALAHVRNAVAQELLKQQLKVYAGYKSKIARVLKALPSESSATAAAVTKYMDAMTRDHQSKLEEHTRSNHHEALVRQALEKMQRHEVDQGQDVVAFNGKVCKIADNGKTIEVTERDELKRLRVTKSLPYPAPVQVVQKPAPPGNKSAPATWLEANGVDKSQIATLQRLLGTALMANRPNPYTVVQFVGTGAASLAAALQAIAGELAVAPPVRDLAALTTKSSHAATSKLRGHRWALINADESSIKYAGRAAQKLAGASTSALPIVLSRDRSPVLLPDSWSVVYVPVHLAIDTVTADVASAWYRWMLGAPNAPTQSITALTSAALIRSLAGPIVDDFLAEEGWWPPGKTDSEHAGTRSTSTIASIVPAVEKLAASRALGALPITLHLLMELLEQRKFHVTRPANRLTVEWFHATAFCAP